MGGWRDRVIDTIEKNPSWFRLFLILIILLIFISSAKASTIATETSTRLIDIINQTGIDVNFTYSFTEINDTHWRADFCIEPNTNFNIVSYPLQNLTAGIGFETPLNIRYNVSSRCGWFYLIFRNGFKVGERAKFGLNSTIIQSTLGDTQPFLSTTRAICRTTNAVHVVAINGTQVDYWNSTDGITWRFMRLDGSSANDDAWSGATVNIACSGTRVFVTWIDADTRRDIDYRNSSDEGANWNSLVGGTEAPILVDGTGTSATVLQIGNCMFGNGDNVYCAYQWDAGTVESIWILNVSVYGGSSPTLRQKDMEVDINAQTSSPNLFVNMSGTTEEIYVVYIANATGSASGRNMFFNYSKDSGSTWGGTFIGTKSASWGTDTFSMVVLNGQIHILSSRSQSVTLSLMNSTDGGATFTEWWVGNTIMRADSLATDGVNNLYAFGCYGTQCYSTGTPETNVSLYIWNATSGISSRLDWQGLNSNISTRPNCNWYNASQRIECVFINASVGTSPIDLQYDYISTYTAPSGNLYGLNFSEYYVYSDSILKKIYKIVVGSTTYAESMSRKLSLNRFGSLSVNYYESLFKSAQHSQTVADLVTYYESMKKGIGRIIGDSSTYAENIWKGLYKIIVNPIDLTETIIKTSTGLTSITVGSFIDFADSVVRNIDLHRIAISYVDYYESIKKGVGRVIDDSLSYGEGIWRELYKVVINSVDFTETTIKTSFALTEVTVGSFLTYADGVIRGLDLNRFVSSVATFTDSVVRSLQLTRYVSSFATYYESLTQYVQSIYYNAQSLTYSYASALLGDTIVRVNDNSLLLGGAVALLGIGYWYSRKKPQPEEMLNEEEFDE